MISVIVPIYNVEKYLDKCINSILNQTYDNLEILLIDDGSTDESGTICDEFAKIDDRIKVFHKINSGVSDTRNMGLDKATGDYISFIDSDDYLEKHFYEKLILLVEKTGSDIVQCNYYYLDENGKSLSKNDFKSFKCETRDEKYERLSYDEPGLVLSWDKLFKKKVFKDIRYPSGKINEDTYLIPDILKNCNIFTFSNEKLYYHIKRKNSIMTSSKISRLDEIYAFEHWIEFFSNDDKFRNMATIRTLDSIIKNYRVIKKIISKEDYLKISQKFSLYLKQISNISIKKRLKYYFYKIFVFREY